MDYGYSETWLHKFSGMNTDPGLKEYIYAYYYSITTMMTVGYGDITPKTLLEMSIAAFTMLFGCGIFGYSFNLIGKIMNEMNEESDKLNTSLMAIKNYMRKKNINNELQYHIKEYVEYYLKSTNQTNSELEDKIINTLTIPLKKQLQLETNKIVLKQSKIFKDNFS